jgi:5-formyltetrahydrofolate cyclo-ligase
MPGSALTKTDLRRSMRSALTLVEPRVLRKASSALICHLIDDRSWPTSGAVGLFGGLQGEIDLIPMIAWLRGRNLVPTFFGFNEGHLTPKAVVEADDLEKGPFGVLQPKAHCRELPLELLRVILVPGLAFGKKDLARLGRGKGHYDRLFADDRMAQAQRWGVCLSDQLVAKVPTEAHDQPMHRIVTEEGWL